jgi:GNAT superfamily N-acetyltransferase
MATIRDVAASDHDEWRGLWRGYQLFYGVTIPDLASQILWTRLMDAAEPIFGAVAVQHGHCAGLVHCVVHRSSWTVENSCYLQDLYVAESMRGQSIGRRLIEHVYDKASQLNCSRVYWLTHETNATARSLYDRVAARTGFIEYEKSLAP